MVKIYLTLKDALINKKETSILVKYEKKEKWFHYEVYNSFTEFANVMLFSELNKRSWHEILKSNTIMRYCFDVENEKDDIETALKMKDINVTLNYINEFCNQFKTILKLDQLNYPKVLISSRNDNKFSLHIIFDIWAPDSIHNFNVATILNEYSQKVFKITVDTNIYPKNINTNMQLRMPFQIKQGIGKSSMLKPLLNTGQIIQDFNLEYFCSYLITFQKTKDCYYLLPELKNEFIIPYNLDNKKIKINYDNNNDSDRVLSWFRDIIPNFKNTPIKFYEGTLNFKFTLKMYCYKINRIHLGNHMSFYVQPNLNQLTLNCTDVLCKRNLPIDYSFYDIINSNKKIDLDSTITDWIYTINKS